MDFPKRSDKFGLTSNGRSVSCNEENDTPTGCTRKKPKGYCSDCKLNLCRSCIKNLKKDKKEPIILDTYRILTDENTDVEAYERNKNVFVEKCKQHSEKYVKYFCKPCDKLCCQICCTAKHKACEEVTFIPDIIDSFEESKEFRVFYKEIGDLCYVLEKEKEKYTEIREALNKSNTESIRAIRQQREKINKYFDMLEETVQVKNEEKKNASIQNLQELEGDNGRLLETLKELKRDLNKKENRGYICQMFITMKSSKDTMNIVREGTEKLTKEEIASYVYVQDKEIARFMKRIQHFGHLVVTGTQAKVITGHEAKIEGELDTKEGDVINIVAMQEDGWLKGELNNQIGLIPVSHVEVLLEDELDGSKEAILYSRTEEVQQSSLIEMSSECPDSENSIVKSSDEFNSVIFV